VQPVKSWASERQVNAFIDANLDNVMKIIYGLLLSLLGFLLIVINRFAVEETLRIVPMFAWLRLPVWVWRIVVILSGTFFVIFGVLSAMGYLQ
jgi:hypothetical protein